MTGGSLEVLPKPDDLREQARDWSLIALLLEPPGPGWVGRLQAAAEDVVDPELCSAVELASRQGNEYFHQCLMGPSGTLASRESAYRSQRDWEPLIADLKGMAATFGFHRFGAEPEDHITNLVAFMAHIVSLQETAMVDDRVGEAVYLEGIAEWLRSAHLAWFTEDLVMALVEIEVCYLSHVARALEMRVHPAGDTTGARRRPSDQEVAEALSKREPSG